MSKKYRVWTSNFGGTVTCMNDWTTYGQCRQFCLGRWGHLPPFAFISSAADEASFRRSNRIWRD